MSVAAGIVSALGAGGRGESTAWSRKLSLFLQSPPHMAEITSLRANVVARTDQFDLFHVRSLNAWQNIFHPTNVLNQSAMESELATFEAQDWGDMKFILQIQTGGTAIDFSNNAHWANIVSNLQKIGAVYADSPLFTGIFWDWEYYGGTYWFNDTTAVGLSGTLAQKCVTVQSRFKQLMNGLLDNWPDVLLSTSHGAGSGTSASYYHLGTGGWTISHNDVAFANELMSPAFIGCMEAVADRGHIATLYDGGEYYGVRDAADMVRVRDWQQVLMPRNPQPPSGTWVSTLFQPGMADKYRAGSNIGLFDRSDYPGTSPEGVSQWGLLPAATFTTMIEAAMQNIPGLTWLYTEHHDWIGIGHKTAVPSNYLDAVAEGRRLGRL